MFIKFFYLLFLIDRDTSKSHIKRFVFSKLVAFWFSKSLLKTFFFKSWFSFWNKFVYFSKTFCLSGVVDKRVTFWFSKSLKKTFVLWTFWWKISPFCLFDSVQFVTNEPFWIVSGVVKRSCVLIFYQQTDW